MGSVFKIVFNMCEHPVLQEAPVCNYGFSDWNI